MSKTPTTNLIPSIYLKEYDINSLNFLTFSNKSYEFHLKEFAFIEELGSGRFGIVRKYRHLPSDQMLAIKVNLESLRQKVNLNRMKEDLQKIKIQIDLHNNLSSPGHLNILTVYGHCFIENQFLICMEVMDISLKELYLKVHEEIYNFPANLSGYITCAVVNGLIYCEEKNIIHRDIKPANILLNWTGEIKLCDFGEASFLEGSLATTYSGTIAYWPPERFNGLHTYNIEKYDVRADIWSLGISMMEIIRGSLPYQEENDGITDASTMGYVKLQNRIMHTSSDDLIAKTFQGRETYGVSFKKFIKLCLQEYENRPKYEQLLNSELYLRYFSYSPDNVRYELCKACVRINAIVNLITNVILLSSFGGYVLIVCSSKVLICCIMVVLDLFFNKDIKIWVLYLVFEGLKFLHGFTILIISSILVFTPIDKFAYDRFQNTGFDIIRWFSIILQMIINVIIWFSVLRLFLFKKRMNKQGIRNLENGIKI